MYFILDESVGSKYIVFPCLSDILAAEKCVHSLGCYKIIRLNMHLLVFQHRSRLMISSHATHLGIRLALSGPVAHLHQQRLMGSSSRNI